MKPLIAPSLLAADFLNLANELKKIDNSSCEWLHLDVMDGNFVPNLTFGYALITQVRQLTTKKLDVHLMINNPCSQVDYYLKAGADSITFHYEAVDSVQIQQLITKIHQHGVQVGIAIKPDTDVKVLAEYLEIIDLVLVMSVEPGFGGQQFLENSLAKLDWLVKQRQVINNQFLLEIDGGINYETAQLVVNHGCQVLVAGSYLFGNDFTHRIEQLQLLSGKSC